MIAGMSSTVSAGCYDCCAHPTSVTHFSFCARFAPNVSTWLKLSVKFRKYTRRGFFP